MRARFDGLTGLLGAAAWFEEVRRLEGVVEELETCWIVVADLDRFKAVNDRHGHPGGDAVLEAFAGQARLAVPSGCRLARVGGDEFAALLVGRHLSEARAVGERLREAATELPGSASQTISVGIAGWLPATEPFDEALWRAGVALEAAKRAGGDRSHVYGLD
jgi:diguanylate cyclase